MLSDILVDDDRFREILDEEIDKGTIESYPKYAIETDETRQKAKDFEKKRREDYDKREAEKKEKAGETAGKPKVKSANAKKDAGSMADLAALIQQRQKSRAGNFFDSLEAKYAPKSRGSKRSTPMEEPPEEAFQAMAARKKQKQNAKKKAKDEDEEMDLGEEDVGASEDEEEAPRKKKAKTKARRGRAKAGSAA